MELQRRQRVHSEKTVSNGLGALWGHTVRIVMILYRADQALIWLLVMVMAGAEVQDNFSPECKRFLYMGTQPRGLEEQPFKKICQYYSGKPRFVTLYDAFNHIPVYSAYTFKRSDGFKKVDVPWMYEPQVGCVLQETSHLFERSLFSVTTTFTMTAVQSV